MNIGFDAKRLFNNHTGLGNYSRTLVRNLLKYNHSDYFQLYTTKIHADFANETWINNNQISVHTPQNKLFKSYWRSIYLPRLLKQNKVNLYHGLSHELPLGMNDVQIKSIVTMHDLIFKIYPETYSPIDRYIYDSKFKRSAEQADVVIAISENTKNDLIKYYSLPTQKIKVLYQSCDELFFEKSILNHQDVLAKYGIPPEYILYVGSIMERKNIINLIKAYHLLNPNIQIPLVLVGNGKKYKEECLELINELKLNNKVFIISNLFDNHELKCVYEKSVCFVYPSLYEGFGIPIIEALLSKTIVCTSSTSCMPEAGGKYSLYFDPNNVESISHTLEKALQLSQNERINKISDSFDFAYKTFNSETTSTQLLALYKSLL